MTFSMPSLMKLKGEGQLSLFSRTSCRISGRCLRSCTAFQLTSRDEQSHFVAFLFITGEMTDAVCPVTEPWNFPALARCYRVVSPNTDLGTHWRFD